MNMMLQITVCLTRLIQTSEYDQNDGYEKRCAAACIHRTALQSGN